MSDRPTRARAATEEASGAVATASARPRPSRCPTRWSTTTATSTSPTGSGWPPRRRSRPRPRSACPGSCRSAATCRARGGPSRRPPPTTPWSPGWRCTPTRRPGSPRRASWTTRWREIERLARAHDRVRAVGETGLDHFRTGEEGRAAQVESFRRHVDLAKRLDKTLVIHDRDAHAEVLEVIDERGCPGPVGDALLLRRRRGRARLPRPRRLPQLRRHGHLQERRPAAQRAGRRAARPAAGRDRRAVPDARRPTGAVPTPPTWSR